MESDCGLFYFWLILLNIMFGKSSALLCVVVGRFFSALYSLFCNYATICKVTQYDTIFVMFYKV